MNGVKRDGTMVDMLLPPLLLVTTYTTTTSTFPPGLVAGGRAGHPTALVVCTIAASYTASVFSVAIQSNLKSAASRTQVHGSMKKHKHFG